MATFYLTETLDFVREYFFIKNYMELCLKTIEE